MKNPTPILLLIVLGALALEAQQLDYDPWQEDFNGPSSQWGMGNWTFDTNLCEFRPEQLSFQDGVLSLTVEEKQEPGNYRDKPYWGGEYYSPGLASRYGRYECLMRPQINSGMVASFFLAFYDFDPGYSYLEENCEIDIEFCGRTDQVQFALHYVDSWGVLQHPQAIKVDLPLDASEDFHWWVIDWTPQSVRFYMDDLLLMEFDDPRDMAEMEFAMEPHMNLWISSSPEWVGPLDEGNLPASCHYKELRFIPYEG